MPHVPSLGCPDDVRRERAAGNGPSQRGAVGKCAFPTDGGERRERGRRAGFCPSIYLTSPSPALLCRGAGYTEHVRPSSAAWACQGSQSSSIIPCLHWASSSKTRWQHMCCVPSAENTTRASQVLAQFFGSSSSSRGRKKGTYKGGNAYRYSILALPLTPSFQI